MQAYQQTAISAVERQLKYDLMTYEEGRTSEEVLKDIENYEYSVKYEDVGKIIENEIVVSKYVANIYGIEVGDIISILYGGKDYKLEVCNIINTNDFLSQVIYFNVENSSLSEEFCEDKTYYYFKGNSNEISDYELLSGNMWTQNLTLILIIAVIAGVVVYGCSKK